MFSQHLQIYYYKAQKHIWCELLKKHIFKKLQIEHPVRWVFFGGGWLVVCLGLLL